MSLPAIQIGWMELVQAPLFIIRLVFALRLEVGVKSYLTDGCWILRWRRSGGRARI